VSAASPVAPDAFRLFWTAREIDKSAVPAAKRFAYAVGRVLEREGAALYTWGDADRLELPLGIDDDAGVRAVQDRLAGIRRFDGGR
jgi:hypothetical protein